MTLVLISCCSRIVGRGMGSTSIFLEFRVLPLIADIVSPELLIIGRTRYK